MDHVCTHIAVIQSLWRNLREVFFQNVTRTVVLVKLLGSTSYVILGGTSYVTLEALAMLPWQH